MVFRIFWNVSAGLLHRAVSKNTIKKGMAINYPAVWRARPGFLDCDVNMHLNNASYLFNMELARWHFSAYVIITSTTYGCELTYAVLLASPVFFLKQ